MSSLKGGFALNIVSVTDGLRLTAQGRKCVTVCRLCNGFEGAIRQKRRRRQWQSKLSVTKSYTNLGFVAALALAQPEMMLLKLAGFVTFISVNRYGC